MSKEIFCLESIDRIGRFEEKAVFGEFVEMLNFTISPIENKLKISI